MDVLDEDDGGSAWACTACAVSATERTTGSSRANLNRMCVKGFSMELDARESARHCMRTIPVYRFRVETARSNAQVDIEHGEQAAPCLPMDGQRYCRASRP